MLIDALHLGRSHVIGLYLLPGQEPALVDAGPTVCADAVEEGLAAGGLALADVRHLLLTHVHPDHAGGAGELVRRHPGLQVHVHEAGAPHLVDTTRLAASVHGLYGEAADTLFGPFLPVPAGNVRVLGDRVLELDVLPTPGHAWHHVAFLGPDGSCYPGDAVGCQIPPGRFLYPASAPPGVDLEAWERSLTALLERSPTVLRLPHFGEVADPAAHVERMRERLRAWADRVRAGATVEEFVAAAERELAEEGSGTEPHYRQLPGFDLSYAGLKRYLDKQAQRPSGADRRQAHPSPAERKDT